MYDKGILTFKDWFKGQTKHPISGFGLLQNVNVFENKGLAKLDVKFQDSGAFYGRLPIAEEYDDNGNTYTLTGEDGQGEVYRNGTNILGQFPGMWDIKIYKNYLWLRHGSNLSCYGPLTSGGAQWFMNIDTGYVEAHAGVMLVGQDDFLYSGNGINVARIEVLTSGTVGVAPTLDVVKDALKIKEGYFVTCLAEFGSNIAIGASGGASYTSRQSSYKAVLFTWDRDFGTLGNPGLADIPVIFNENGMNAIIQHANKLYISAGTQGNIYVSDGTNYQKISSLPYTEEGITARGNVFYNAMDISPRGNLLVGLSTYGNNFGKGGVYEIDINTEGYPVSFKTTSGLNTGGNQVLKVGFVKTKDASTIRTGWSLATTYKVDQTDFNFTSKATIETPLVNVGTYNNKKTFEHIEWVLAEPLQPSSNPGFEPDGQKIKIWYRKNNKEDYTLINEWTYKQFADNGITDVMSFEDIAGIADAEYVQLKIELIQPTFMLYGQNLNLIYVRLW